MKKIISVILTLVLLVSLVTTSAVADDPKVSFSILFRPTTEMSTENNPWIDYVNEKSGANITWIALPRSNSFEKRNVMLSGGEIPDVIIMDTTQSCVTDSLYEEMIEDQVILPLNEYLTEADNIQAYTSANTWAAVTYTDGNIYMVPRSTIVRDDFIMIRKDWREKLGFTEKPATMEELRAYYKAVATGDPDGNGKNDTYGISETNTFMKGDLNMNYLASAWHADSSWYLDEDGKVFYGLFAKDGRFKYVLKFFRDLYEDGSLDPDMMTNASIESTQGVGDGKLASVRIFPANGDKYIVQAQALDPNAMGEFIDLPAVPENEVNINEKKIATNAGLFNGWALTMNAKGREKEIIEAMNWFLSDEGWDAMVYGVPGLHYNVEDGNIVKTEAYTNDFSKWNSNTMLFRRANDLNFWMKRLVPDMEDEIRTYIEKGVEVANSWIPGLIGMYSSKQTEFFAKDIYSKTMLEVIAKIIYGDLPLEAWDEFVDSVYKAGWQDVVDEYDAYFQAHK